MKKNIFKKVGLLGISLAASLTLNVTVNAADNCTTYTNYYLFNEINSKAIVENKISQAPEGNWRRFHTTNFPALTLPSDATYVEAESGKVCLTKSGTNDTNCTAGSMSLTDFYTHYKEAMNSNGVATSDNTTYYLHEAWVEFMEGGTEGNSGSSRVDYSSIGTSALVNASIIPDSTTVNVTRQSDSMYGTVQRHITSSNLSGVTGFTLEWWSGNNVTDTVLEPALYKYVYTANCQDDPTPTDETKYTATINYYKEGTTTKIPLKNSSANPYTESNLSDGYTKNVTSPAAADSNCTPLESSVSIRINKANYTHNVYYRCTSAPDTPTDPTPTTTYSARINYWIEKDGVRTPASERDSSVTNYYKSGLENGANDKVTSPTIKNCKVKSSGDKTVSYTIKNKNFEHDVIYLCDEDQPTAFEQTMNNPKTGATMMISAWIIALGAIGYSVYYFMNARKEETAEI